MIRTLGTLALLLAVVGCQGTPSGGPLTPGDDDAQLTILNALADAKGPRTITLDGNPLVIPQVGGARGIAIGGGAHRIDAVDSNGRLMARVDFAVGAGARRTAILTGTSSGVLLQVAVDTAALPAAGTSKIRVVHMAEGTPVLDAYLYRDTETPSPSSRLGAPISYSGDSDAGFPHFISMSPWAYRVMVTPTGSVNGLAESPAFHVLEGEIWSIIVTRSSAGVLLLQPVRER